MIRVKAGNAHTYIDAFYIARTWGGMIEGEPDKEMIKSTLKEANVSMLWGKDRKTIRVVPEDFPKSLPEYEVKVWLCDYDKQLFVVFWTNMNPAEKTIVEIVEESLKDLDYQKDSEEFEF